MRPNKKELKFLTLSYNSFFDLYNEIHSNKFWKRSKYYRYNRIKDVFSIYSELLNYLPIQVELKKMERSRPPMQAELGREVFKFVRNVVTHIPFFKSWEEVWFDKDLVNWYKSSQSIDRFLKRYENKEPLKFRMWQKKEKKMIYTTVNFPNGYSKGKCVYLKEMITEKEGVIFSTVFMMQVLWTQVKDIQ